MSTIWLVAWPHALNAAPEGELAAPESSTTGHRLALQITTEHTDRASDCTDRAGLYDKVRRLSPHVQMDERALEDSVRVTTRFDKHGDEYSAELEFRGARPGERRFRDRGSNCLALEDAVAIAIVLLLDKEIQLRAQTPSVVHHAESTIKTPSGTVRPRAKIPSSMSEIVSVQGGPLWGAFDSTTAWLGGQLALDLRSSWRLGLGTFAFLPQSVSYGRGEVGVSLIAAELRGCRLAGSSFVFVACVAPAFGRLRGTGRGYDESSAVSLVWAALGGSIGVETTLRRRWTGGLDVAMWVPLSDQTLSVENLGVAWNSAPIWASLAVRLGVRFH